MKILISEGQLKLIISESYDDDRLNYLLDKVNAMGMAALTDKEKKSLENISNGVDDDSEEDLVSDVIPSTTTIIIFSSEDVPDQIQKIKKILRFFLFFKK